MNKKEPFQKGLVPIFGQGRIQGGFKRRWSGVGRLLPFKGLKINGACPKNGKI